MIEIKLVMEPPMRWLVTWFTNSVLGVIIVQNSRGINKLKADNNVLQY